MTNEVNSTILGDSMFQLRMMHTDDCRLWYNDVSTGQVHMFAIYYSFTSM